MNAKFIRVVHSVGFCACTLSAQVIVGTAGDGGGRSNQLQLHTQQAISTQAHKDVVVFIGDTVLPQIVDGASWKTTLKFVNLENHTVVFKVLFFSDNGTDLALPILGVGPATINLTVTLPTANSITIETAGTADQLAQGWASMVKTVSTDSVGGFAIFRQRIPGIPDQEAVVPIVNQFSSHFVLLFDNQGFVTAVALANPTGSAVAIPVNIRNEQGSIIDQRSFALGAFSHAAFALPEQWASTAGGRGTIEFITSGFGVGALGLRFNGSAFTSFDVLQNFAWTQ